MTVELPPPDRCDQCGGESTVLDVRSRGSKACRSGWVFRRRGCVDCGNRWNTWESVFVHPGRLLGRLEGMAIDDPMSMLQALIQPKPSRGEP